jgi:hypothetical protein
MGNRALPSAARQTILMIDTTFSCTDLPISVSILLMPESASIGVILGGLQSQ